MMLGDETDQKPNEEGFRSAQYDFNSMLKWANAQGYKIELTFNSYAPNSQFPYTVLLASPEMMRSYFSFGDLLDFKILPGTLHHIEPYSKVVLSYKVAVFTVFDTDEQPQLAAYALIKEETPQAIMHVLSSFGKIHSRSPTTLMTGDQAFVLQAVDELIQHNQYKSHRIDPE